MAIMMKRHMFDSKIKTLNLVLRYEKNYYFTTLNVSNIEIPTQYLKEIPIEILNRIMDANNSIISRKSGQKIQKIANLQYYKSKANYGTKKKGISR